MASKNDPMAALQRRTDRLDRHVIDPVPAHGQIVFVPQPVHVDAEGQVLGRLIVIQLALQ
jgi:hypothetical protein